jgi:hypothetical protein
VGTSTGQLYRVDIRQKGLLNGHYKGLKGSVREVACLNNYIFSASLDRHLRMHAADSKQLVKSVNKIPPKEVSLLIEVIFHRNISSQN